MGASRGTHWQIKLLLLAQLYGFSFNPLELPCPSHCQSHFFSSPITVVTFRHLSKIMAFVYITQGQVLLCVPNKFYMMQSYMPCLSLKLNFPI